MECLAKYVNEINSVYLYHDNNDIVDKPYFNAKKRKRGLKWTVKEIIDGKDNVLKYYAVKTAKIEIHRTSIIIEKTDEKVSLKLFNFHKYRSVGTHYFVSKQVVHYVTYNKKTNILYLGQTNKRGSSIRSNPFVGEQLSHFFSSLYDTIKRNQFLPKEVIQDSNALLFELIDLFCTECFDDFNIDDYVGGVDIKNIFLKNYLTKNNVIIPDNYAVFFNKDQITLREIKRAKNNLLLAIEKKYKIKGKKFHRVLHKLESFNPYFLKVLLHMFGIERLKRLTDDELIKMLNYSTNTYYDSITQSTEHFSEKEKDRMLLILLDCVTNDGSYYTFQDHISFITKLKFQYNENVVWNSRTRDEFTVEHVELSNLISKYQDGIYDRKYSPEFVDSFNTAFISNGGVYYPVLFMDDTQYKEESEHQHNCVKTYVKRLTCFIISLREGSNDSKERATIQFEISIVDDEVIITRVQTLGRFNKKLTEKWDEPLKMLDDHIEHIRNKFKISDYKVIKTNAFESKVFDVELNQETHRPQIKLEIEKKHSELDLIQFENLF